MPITTFVTFGADFHFLSPGVTFGANYDYPIVREESPRSDFHEMATVYLDRRPTKIWGSLQLTAF